MTTAMKAMKKNTVRMVKYVQLQPSDTRWL